jgi:hypothetical protein
LGFKFSHSDAKVGQLILTLKTWIINEDFNQIYRLFGLQVIITGVVAQITFLQALVAASLKPLHSQFDVSKGNDPKLLDITK